MSKLSFRAKALDPSKPMPIYMADELPDLPDYSAINRAVPQMPSGMKKEEECEHHLQRAICTGLIIPTPEVSDIQDEEMHTKLYPANYKQPRQLIHMQPFAMEQDITDYDMDSEDERWLEQQAARQRLELAPLKFEEMMDRLEKSSGQTVVSIADAKALLKEDDDLIIAVFDYWLNKRLKMQHPLILAVKTEHRTGKAPNNPYLAFRRRAEKMQTRKNRKNGETSYEKMFKLRRDLSRAVTLLELVKRREKTKREVVLLTLEVVEKRYAARDFSGAVAAEAAAAACAQLLQQRTGTSSGRPAFQPLFHNHHHYAQAQHNHLHHAGGAQAGGSGSGGAWATGASALNKSILKDEAISRKERRQYKKRKHKAGGSGRNIVLGADLVGGGMSSDDDGLHIHRTSANIHSPEPEEDDGPFAFRRNKLCTYHEALPTICGSWPWQQPSPIYPHLQDDVNDKRSPPPLSPGGISAFTTPFAEKVPSTAHQQQPDKRYRYTLASIITSDGEDHAGTTEEVDYWRRRHRKRRCIGFARRRLGRGGRVILDRACAPGYPAGLAADEFWSALNYTIYDSERKAPRQLQPELSTTAFSIKQEPLDSARQNTDPQNSFSTNLLTNSSSIAQQQQLRRLSNSSCSADTVTCRRTSVTNSVSDAGALSVKVEATEGDSVCENNRERETASGAADVKGERQDEMEMVEFLQHVRRDWLHFRPKTPPPDYAPPCYLLPPLSPPPAFSSDLPFTLELRPIPNTYTPFYPYDYDESQAVLLNDSPFITEPFIASSSMTDDMYNMVDSGGLELGDSDGDVRGARSTNTGDSGVWSMELGAGDVENADEGRFSWKVTEEQEEPDSSPSLHTVPITLNNTKHKSCDNANDDDTDDNNDSGFNNTIGSSTFTVQDIHPVNATTTTDNRRKTLLPTSTDSKTTKNNQQQIVFKEEIVAACQPPTIVINNNQNKPAVNNVQQRLRLQQMSPAAGSCALVKKQLQQVRGVMTTLPQQGGNGSRAAGLVWRGEHRGVVKGGGDATAALLQTNGIFCNAQLDLQEVSSGVRPKSIQHHTYVSGVVEGTNRSNANAINIHSTHSVTLNSHSANNATPNILDHIHTPNSLTTTVSLSDSPVLPHPKVGVGGTVTAAPLTSTSTNAGSGVSSGAAKAAAIVQQRKNNQLVMEVT